jgi:SAM-dependent methyltransferase
VSEMSRLPRPGSWSDIPSGDLLRQSATEALAPWWPRLFGYHLLKMGPLAAQIEAGASPIAHHFSLFDDAAAQLRGDFLQLPLQNASVDAVLMSLLLEFEDNPYRVLRETDRVLIAGGYLFIVGVNPLSPAFLGKLLPKYQQQLPWSGHFFLPSRVKDWLGLLGYQIVCDERRVYHSLLGKVARHSLWQQGLEAWLPGAGCLYIIGGRKLESPLTPIQEKRPLRQGNWAPAPTVGRSAGRSVKGS